jgi:hypothetical protein
MKKSKNEQLKASVLVEGKSIGFFYQISPYETKAEMNFRIVNIVTRQYGFCNISITYLDINNK